MRAALTEAARSDLAAGVVEAVGPGVRHLAEGDKVIITLRPPCGVCYFCVRGEPELCANSPAVATGMLRSGPAKHSDGAVPPVPTPSLQGSVSNLGCLKWFRQGVDPDVIRGEQWQIPNTALCEALSGCCAAIKQGDSSDRRDPECEDPVDRTQHRRSRGDNVLNEDDAVPVCKPAAFDP